MKLTGAIRRHISTFLDAVHHDHMGSLCTALRGDSRCTDSWHHTVELPYGMARRLSLPREDGAALAPALSRIRSLSIEPTSPIYGSWLVRAIASGLRQLESLTVCFESLAEYHDPISMDPLAVLTRLTRLVTSNASFSNRLAHLTDITCDRSMFKIVADGLTWEISSGYEFPVNATSLNMSGALGEQRLAWLLTQTSLRTLRLPGTAFFDQHGPPNPSIDTLEVYEFGVAISIALATQLPSLTDVTVVWQMTNPPSLMDQLAGTKVQRLTLVIRHPSNIHTRCWVVVPDDKDYIKKSLPCLKVVRATSTCEMEPFDWRGHLQYFDWPGIELVDEIKWKTEKPPLTLISTLI